MKKVFLILLCLPGLVFAESSLSNGPPKKTEKNGWGDSWGEVLLTMFLNTNIVNGGGYSMLRNYGHSYSNLIRIRIEDPTKTGYFLFGGNFLNGLIDDDQFQIQRFRQYSPSLDLGVRTIGFGGYLFSERDDDVSFNAEMGWSFIDSEIELNRDIHDNDYEGYWVSIGLSEKISSQLRIYAAMTLMTPLSSDVIHTPNIERQKNLMTTIEVGWQLMLFNI